MQGEPQHQNQEGCEIHFHLNSLISEMLQQVCVNVRGCFLKTTTTVP